MDSLICESTHYSIVHIAYVRLMMYDLLILEKYIQGFLEACFFLGGGGSLPPPPPKKIYIGYSPPPQVLPSKVPLFMQIMINRVLPQCTRSPAPSPK